jgi:hypothetical protein
VVALAATTQATVAAQDATTMAAGTQTIVAASAVPMAKAVDEPILARLAYPLYPCSNGQLEIFPTAIPVVVLRP